MCKINKHVLIRPIKYEDAEILMTLNNDRKISSFVVGNPVYVSLEEQLRWMDSISNEKNTDRFMIDCDDETVGTLIISNIDNSNGVANINIKLLNEMQGKGIGTSSIILGLDYCFNVLSLNCVTAHVLSYNDASLALFRKCGFIREGVLRSRVIKNGKKIDLVSFSILKSEFNKEI
ncbi:hypothetical protein B5E87_02815 [Massilimicrobiota sp. An142]|uniref:GNAT family N-acetyltransferase n=1 Tax=Massilimicrobiota sp. An142 TaxID=1965564 RepID=UPI000B3652A0|nr:GNAT family protein [Massilimicrobiota sp. An142]OUQ14431.1 hypothetical protein B5E87_02815 [Massilimicrobiota sp. An142]